MKRKNEDWHGDAGLGRRGSEGVFDEGAQAIGIAVVIIAGDVVSHLPRRVAGDLDGGGLAWLARRQGRREYPSWRGARDPDWCRRMRTWALRSVTVRTMNS